MSGVTYYKSGRISMLKTMPQLVKQQTVNAVRRATRNLRNEIHAEYIKRGLGHALYTGRGTRILGGSELKTIIKSATTRQRGDVIETSIYIKGTAALVQQGGRTKAHEIIPSRAKFLGHRNSSAASVDARKAMWRRVEFERSKGNASFGLAGALSNINTPNRKKPFFASGPVKHPGSNFVKDDFMGRATSRGLPKYKEEVAKGLARVAEIVNAA